MHANGFAQYGMTNLVAAFGVLGFRVFEEIARQKTAIDGDVDVLADGG